MRASKKTTKVVALGLTQSVTKKKKAKLVRRMISRFKRSGLVEDKVLYCAQGKEYRHIMKNKENGHRKSQIGLLLSVANDPQAFWNQIRRYRRKPPVTNGIPKDDWYAHFENLFNSAVENLPSEHSEYEGESSVVDEFLDFDMSEEEVKAAIRHLINNKSPGPYGIMSEILKALDTAIVPFLVKYFNELFSYGPTEWTKAIIVPLHKKGDINNVDNYRGISLLNILSNIFTLSLIHI